MQFLSFKVHIKSGEHVTRFFSYNYIVALYVYIVTMLYVRCLYCNQVVFETNMLEFCRLCQTTERIITSPFSVSIDTCVLCFPHHNSVFELNTRVLGSFHMERASLQGNPPEIYSDTVTTQTFQFFVFPTVWDECDRSRRIMSIHRISNMNLTKNEEFN